MCDMENAMNFGINWQWINIGCLIGMLLSMYVKCFCVCVFIIYLFF